jgi:predicted nuclease with TOPRIM domain
LIQHLKSSGVYDDIRKLLQKARETYKSKDPQKRAQTLTRELTRLQAELNILQKQRDVKSLAQEFARKYPGADYNKILEDKIIQLQNEIARIQQSLPTGQLQQQLP